MAIFCQPKSEEEKETQGKTKINDKWKLKIKEDKTIENYSSKQKQNVQIVKLTLYSLKKINIGYH